MASHCLAVLAWSCLLSVRLAASDGAPLGPIVDGEGLHADQMTLFDLDFRDVLAAPRIADGVLRLENLAAKAYGGRVTGVVLIGLGTGDIDCRLQVHDVDLGRFLSRFAGIAAYQGRVSGKVHFHLPRGRWSQARGQGSLRLAQGRVIQAPGLATLLFGDPGAVEGRDRGWAGFRIAAGAIKLDRVVLDNDSFHVLIKGTIHRDGGLDLVVSPFAKLEHFHMIPGIGDVTGFLLSRMSGRLARFDVTGHLSSPSLTADPF